MPTYTLEREGKKATVTSPRTLSPEELTAVSARHFGPATPPAPAPKPDDRSILGGAVADTLGVSGRPGAVPLTGAPGTKTPLGVILKPEGVAEHLTQAAVTAPAIAAGGEAAYFAPWLGRSLMSGVIGAAEAAARGDSMAFGALLDAAVAAGTEGASALIPKVRLPYHQSLEQMAERLDGMKRAYAWATEAPGKALDALKDRLPKGKWLSVPTLGKTKLTAQEAIQGLKGLEGADYQQARGEIISEFNRLDIQSGVRGSRGPRPYAGQAFNIRTSPERFTPPSGTLPERAAAAALSKSPGAQEVRTGLKTAADTATTEEAAPGVPLGALALTAVPGFGEVARHARHLIH